MADLLKALDWKMSAGRGICVIALIAFVTLLAIFLGVAVAKFAAMPVVFLQCGIWALWLIWLGVIFPRQRQRDNDIPCPFPYRRAFLRELLPGVAIAFSQLLRPAVSGVLEGDRELSLAAAAAMGLPVLLSGATIVFLGVAALGVARTLFVYEYVPTNTLVTIVGIFHILRHPLFLGGALLSLGLAICTGSQTAVALALANACVIPIYVQLEDRRCCTALGPAYADYRAVVGGVIPRRRSLISRSAFAHHASANISPGADHNLVGRK